MPIKDELLPFYPAIAPNQELMLPVGTLHHVYVASYGNPEGIPIVVLHGGPGSGTDPYYAQFFDPDHYHIILTDQRGAGKSRPKGEMKENTTQDLIADLEIIRHHLNIDKWAVFGGSWGSTLALLYAEAHPEQVLGLVLRGIFLARPEDVRVFTQEGSPAALLHSREWETFKADTTRLISAADLTHLSVTTDDIYPIYYELLQHPNNEIKEEAAGTLAAWEKLNSYLEIDTSEMAWSRSPDGINMGLTEATYFKQDSFIKPNQILNDIGYLKNIPIYIVQGRYDLVCPPYMADELETALLTINEKTHLIVRYNCLAGHAHKEPAIRHALILATNQLVAQLRPIR